MACSSFPCSHVSSSSSSSPLSRMSERPIFIVTQKLFIAAHEQASVHNFSLFFVFHQHFHVLEFGRVFVDRNGSGAAGRIHKDQPLARIFGEIQKIGLIIHLEIQFKSPPKSCHGLQRI